MSNFLSDVAAERGILSGLCQFGKDAFLEVRDLLQANAFTDNVNQILYSVLCHIFEKDIEAKIDLHIILSSAKELGLEKQLVSDKTNSQYLQRIVSFTVRQENIREFARKIRILQESRNLIGILSDSQEEIKKTIGTESITEIISKVENPIFDFANRLTDNDQQIQLFGKDLSFHVEEIINNPKESLGISIGFPIYEKIIGGLNDGIHLISARSGCGKSNHAMNSALYASGKNKIPVLYIDSELTLEGGQYNRALARVSGVEFRKINNRILNEIETRKIRKSAKLIQSFPLSFINISGMDFENVISLIRRWLIQTVGYNKNGKLNNAIIIYDYIKLTDFNALKTAKEYEILGMRFSKLHDISVKYKVPILGYVQQNREMQVSASDRQVWFASSVSSLQFKSDEEIIEDGPENGNRKMYIEKNRWGELLNDGDYINYNLNGSISTFIELNTRNQSHRIEQEESEENNNEE